MKAKPKVALRRLTDLQPDRRNANLGTPRGRKLLAESLRDYGAGRSVLADREGRIIAGNKTVDEATKLGMPVRVIKTTGKELVVVHRTDLDLRDERARKLALADNRVADLDLNWNTEMIELQADGLDLSAFWTDAEMRTLLGSLASDPAADAVVLPPTRTTIKAGDLFELGPHRLLCGDSTSADAVSRLLAGVTPTLIDGGSALWRSLCTRMAPCRLSDPAHGDRCGHE